MNAVTLGLVAGGMLVITAMTIAAQQKATPPEQGKPAQTPPPTAAPATLVNFDKDAPSKLPAGWKAQGTNQKGPVATWEVVADPTAPSGPNVLALSKTNHDSTNTFNICWTA